MATRWTTVHGVAKSQTGVSDEHVHFSLSYSFLGFPGSASGKETTCPAGDIRDAGLNPGLGRSLGERCGNPLQYSCLEKPVGRGAWQAIVHRVTKSQTWLKQFSTCAYSFPVSTITLSCYFYFSSLSTLIDWGDVVLSLNNPCSSSSFVNAWWIYKAFKKNYSKKGEVKEGSLSISMQRDCSVDKIDYCWHSLSASEIEERKTKPKPKKQLYWTPFNRITLSCIPPSSENN